MTTFDDREKSFEAKFARDQELQFKATARRNKLLGLWAAGLLGKTGEAAEEYAKEIIRADFQEAGDDDVIARLAADLGGKATVDEIRAKLAECFAQAKREIMEEG